MIEHIRFGPMWDKVVPEETFVEDARAGELPAVSWVIPPYRLSDHPAGMRTHIGVSLGACLFGVMSAYGFVPFDELPVLYSLAEMFVFPSLYEGFGLPPLEAMACGTPVVASNASSLPEVVGDAALTIDPYDIEGLAKAMEQLLMDQELRSEMRARGLVRAKLFSWERTARETLRVYEEVYAKGRLG